MPRIDDRFIVFFESETMQIAEAGARLMRRMIEDDLPNSPDFPEGEDPYKYLAEILHKGERTVRGWVSNWSTSSGGRPSLIDFINVVNLSKSRRAVEFFEELLKDATPQQREHNHGKVLKKVATHIRELADTIDELAVTDE